ncbi:hypothetical protein H6G27_26525 [Nostoc linckia FACHB-104]|nr:hypothetical protein [Nostoc linckia FACHB-104]
MGKQSRLRKQKKQETLVRLPGFINWNTGELVKLSEAMENLVNNQTTSED